MCRWIRTVCLVAAAVAPTVVGNPAASSQTAQQDADITKANSYDDTWQNGSDGWVATMWHLQLKAGGKTDGFVVLLGDSITYATPFGQWARSGSGKTSADVAICNWMHAGTWGDGLTNNSSNGWYLAANTVRTNGSFTAQSGITSGQYLSGTYYLPSMDQMFTAGFANPDGKQYGDARVAVILLGTNDLYSGTPAAVAGNLGADHRQAGGGPDHPDPDHSAAAGLWPRHPGEQLRHRHRQPGPGQENPPYRLPCRDTPPPAGHDLAVQP